MQPFFPERLFCMSKLAPIGIFDSGYGGLTVFKEIEHLLPQYDYIYLGDNARAPYGEKTFDQVYHYSLQSVKWFFNQGCNLVILACNTASAKALRNIQQKDLPKIAPNKRVLGIIRPTSEVIGEYSRSKHVGVLGTRGTVQSESYLIEIDKFFPEVKVTQLACPEWVSLVENDMYNSPKADVYVKKYIDELVKRDSEIDTILLACTHYPLLMDKIMACTPAGTKVLAQGNIIAKGLKDYLDRHPEIYCSKNGKREFFTTGNQHDFDRHSTVFLNRKVKSALASI